MGYLRMYGATNDNALMVMEAYVNPMQIAKNITNMINPFTYVLLVFVTFCNISTYFPLISWIFISCSSDNRELA